MKQKRPHRMRLAIASKALGRRHKKSPTRHASLRRKLLRQQIRLRRPLHKRLVLHPVSVMMILVAGVFIVGLTFRAAADDSYTVTAKVAAAPLLEGAAITSPTDGDVVTASPITLTGTCPDNSYVTLTRNSVFSGVAVCTSQIYSIDTALSAGANNLVVQDFNITDDPGPATPDITITYTPPTIPSGGNSTPTSNPSSTSNTTTGSPQVLLLTTDFRFQAFTVGSTFNWNITLNGGVAPYSSNVDWGDSTKSSATYPRAATVTISHTYTKTGYFPVIVKITDETGATTMLQLVALIKAPGAAGALFQTPSTPTSSSSGNSLFDTFSGSSKWLLLAWPTYIITGLMAVSFWLGERQELRHLLLRPHHGQRLAQHHR